MNQNKADFQIIYNEYREKIFRYISRMIGEDEAEDLTQEVFIKVDRGLENLREKENLSAWIYRIATNTVIDRTRSSGYKKRADSIPEELLVAEDRSIWSGDKVLSTDQKLIEEEMNRCIRGFIDRLPENYRAVLVLSELECLKNREIADALDISLDNVKIRLHRGRSLLKKELEAGCSFYHTPQEKLA